MTKSALQPIILNGDSISQKLVNLEKSFKNIFMDKNARPTFNGKFIFFDMNKSHAGQALSFPERFMHICSLEEKGYSMFPCNNDVAFFHCSNKCVYKDALEDFRKINRTECYYRMARIHWIPEIIILANNSDPRIKVWQKSEIDYKGKKYMNTLIRYEDGLIDYVIILKEDRKTSYKFTTGFPVFLKRNKKQFDADYQAYTKTKSTLPSAN
jgi:hypothetical protein